MEMIAKLMVPKKVSTGRKVDTDLHTVEYLKHLTVLERQITDRIMLVTSQSVSPERLRRLFFDEKGYWLPVKMFAEYLEKYSAKV